MIDYLIPVAEAGDKTYSNGVQEMKITKEDERKAQERIDQIALQKHLDLERGNTKHILEMLQKDTPEAAIYRAMLLQQLEKQNAATAGLNKKDEDNKPGVIRQAASWIGNKALNTAKYVGYAALTHLALKSLLNAGEIYRNGLFPTWKSWQVQSGIGLSPELAKQNNDEYAALGDDIVKREVKLADLPTKLKGQALKYADKLAGNSVDVSKASFILEDFFKDKDGKYFEDLPEDADASDYTKEWAYVLDTGSGNPQLPVSKTSLGNNLFNNLFKVGNLTTLLTEDDNWFMRNPTLRYFDNNITRIGRLSGHNASKRLNSSYTRLYDPDKKIDAVPVDPTGAPPTKKIKTGPNYKDKYAKKRQQFIDDVNDPNDKSNALMLYDKDQKPLFPETVGPDFDEEDNENIEIKDDVKRPEPTKIKIKDDTKPDDSKPGDTKPDDAKPVDPVDDEYSEEGIRTRQAVSTLHSTQKNIYALLTNIDRKGSSQAHFIVTPENMDKVINTLAAANPKDKYDMIKFTDLTAMNSEQGIEERYLPQVLFEAQNIRYKFPTDLKDPEMVKKNKELVKNGYTALISKYAGLQNGTISEDAKGNVFIKPTYNGDNDLYLNEGNTIKLTALASTVGTIIVGGIMTFFGCPLGTAAIVASVPSLGVSYFGASTYNQYLNNVMRPLLEAKDMADLDKILNKMNNNKVED